MGDATASPLRRRANGEGSRARIVNCIEALTYKYGYPPTLREVMDAAEIGSSGQLYFHLTRLSADGKLTWQPGKSRTLRLIGEP